MSYNIKLIPYWRKTRGWFIPPLYFFKQGEAKIAKKITTKFEEIVNFRNIWEAKKKCLASKNKYKTDAMAFESNPYNNVNVLIRELQNDTYKMSPYIEFDVFEPKQRHVLAPQFKDKLVQWSICRVLNPEFKNKFISDTYACIEGRGTHAYISKLNHFIRCAKVNYGNTAYVLQIDIKKFFYNIDRSVLKKIYIKHIKDENILNLIYKITDSSEIMGEVGLPLGNSLSQLSANVYMNEVDQYIKRNLSVKYYVRYMDDMVLILRNKQEAKEVLALVKDFLKERLHLTVNEKKTVYYPLKNGIKSVGFKSFGNYRLLLQKDKKKLRQKIKEIVQIKDIAVAQNKLVLATIKCRYSDSYSFIRQYLSESPELEMVLQDFAGKYN